MKHSQKITININNCSITLSSSIFANHVYNINTFLLPTSSQVITALPLYGIQQLYFTRHLKYIRERKNLKYIGEQWLEQI